MQHRQARVILLWANKNSRTSISTKKRLVISLTVFVLEISFRCRLPPIPTRKVCVDWVGLYMAHRKPIRSPKLSTWVLSASVCKDPLQALVCTKISSSLSIDSTSNRQKITISSIVQILWGNVESL